MNTVDDKMIGTWERLKVSNTIRWTQKVQGDAWNNWWLVVVYDQHIRLSSSEKTGIYPAPKNWTMA